MAARTKKLINDPDRIITDLAEGIAGAHPRMVRLHPDNPRVILAQASLRPGKVGVVIGGGSGLSVIGHLRQSVNWSGM